MKLPILAFLGLSTLALAAEPPRPNILYFYVDDMGWGSIGPNGQAERRAKGLPTVQTPNLDKLAAEGVNFTRSYGCTVCSPARSSQQTGFHQGHTFADRNDPDNAKKAIRAEDITMGDTLSDAGYVTGYWGKWGYGGSKDQENPTIDNVQTLPTSHGYTHVLAELHHVRAHTFYQPTLWHAPAKGNPKGGLELVPNTMVPFIGDKKYPAQPSNHDAPNYPKTAYCDDLYAFATLDFVRTQSQNYNATQQPFFGLLAVQIPHAPFDEIAALPKWDAAYKNDPHFKKLAPQAQQWAAMVTRIDAHFGNILATLEDPNGDGNTDDSVKENTLVIFMSDNGGPGGKNNSELDANGGLRGNKGSIFEGGIRVPTIMRWPGKIAAGSTNDQPIDVSDLLPTFCDLAGTDSPVGLDGVSIAPLLTGKGERRKREFLIHEAGPNASIIRGNHKLIRTKKGLELYDLDADHGEKNDIAKGNPKLVKELEALLLAERVSEPRGFANTYHTWEGKDGALTSNPDNWSDYVYENEGIVYTEEKGAPSLSWTAAIGGRSKKSTTLKADKDLEFLGLEISGEKPTELILEPKVNLTGRNEIRLSENGILTANGGKISSLRWVDVRKGATLQGTGEIDAVLYNNGNVTLAKSVNSDNAPALHAHRDYHESETATLKIPLGGSFLIAGEARLAGKLELESRPESGDHFTILKAGKISGKFSNPDNLVISKTGEKFAISYSKNAVTLTQIETPSS